MTSMAWSRSAVSASLSRNSCWHRPAAPRRRTRPVRSRQHHRATAGAGRGRRRCAGLRLDARHHRHLDVDEGDVRQTCARTSARPLPRRRPLPHHLDALLQEGRNPAPIRAWSSTSATLIRPLTRSSGTRARTEKLPSVRGAACRVPPRAVTRSRMRWTLLGARPGRCRRRPRRLLLMFLVSSWMPPWQGVPAAFVRASWTMRYVARSTVAVSGRSLPVTVRSTARPAARVLHDRWGAVGSSVRNTSRVARSSRMASPLSLLDGEQGRHLLAALAREADGDSRLELDDRDAACVSESCTRAMRRRSSPARRTNPPPRGCVSASSARCSVWRRYACQLCARTTTAHRNQPASNAVCSTVSWEVTPVASHAPRPLWPRPRARPRPRVDRGHHREGGHQPWLGAHSLGQCGRGDGEHHAGAFRYAASASEPVTISESTRTPRRSTTH